MLKSTTKKDREEEGFNLFYQNKSEFEIIGHEKPDFHIRHTEGHIFGVELTDFFYNESSARSKLIPGYVAQILNGGTYKHKNDYEELPLEEMKYKSRDGEKIKSITGIFIEPKKNKDIVNRFRKMISQKNESFKQYLEKFDHVDLIIYDRENFLVNNEENRFFLLFLQNIITEVVKNSPFREIYFITNKKDSGLVYIPLKLLYWSSTLLTFKKHYLNFFQHNNDKKFDKYFNHYYYYLQLLGINKVFEDDVEKFKLYYGNSSIRINNGKYDIKTYNNARLPNTIHPVKIDMHTINSEFDLYLNKLKDKIIGHLLLYFPLKRETKTT